VPAGAGSDRCSRPVSAAAGEQAAAAAAAAVRPAVAVPAGSAVRRYSPDRTGSADPAVTAGLLGPAVAAAAGTGSAPGTDRTATRHHEPAPAQPVLTHHAEAHHAEAHHAEAHHAEAHPAEAHPAQAHHVQEAQDDWAHHDPAHLDPAPRDPAHHGWVQGAQPRRSTPAGAGRRTSAPAAARRTDAAGRRTAAGVAAQAVVGVRPTGTAASGRTAAGAPGRVRTIWARSAGTATGRDRCRGPARCRRRSPSDGALRLSGSSVRSRTATATRRRPGYRPTGSCQPCLHRPTVAEGERYRLQLSDRSHRPRAGRSGPWAPRWNPTGCRR